MIKEMNLDTDDFRVEEKENDLEVYMKHIVDGYAQEISLADESSGTQKIFGLLPFFMPFWGRNGVTIRVSTT